MSHDGGTAVDRRGDVFRAHEQRKPEQDREDHRKRDRRHRERPRRVGTTPAYASCKHGEPREQRHRDPEPRDEPLSAGN